MSLEGFASSPATFAGLDAPHLDVVRLLNQIRTDYSSATEAAALRDASGAALEALRQSFPGVDVSAGTHGPLSAVLERRVAGKIRAIMIMQQGSSASA